MSFYLDLSRKNHSPNHGRKNTNINCWTKKAWNTGSPYYRIPKSLIAYLARSIAYRSLHRRIKRLNDLLMRKWEAKSNAVAEDSRDLCRDCFHLRNREYPLRFKQPTRTPTSIRALLLIFIYTLSHLSTVPSIFYKWHEVSSMRLISWILYIALSNWCKTIYI